MSEIPNVYRPLRGLPNPMDTSKWSADTLAKAKAQWALGKPALGPDNGFYSAPTNGDRYAVAGLSNTNPDGSLITGGITGGGAGGVGGSGGGDLSTVAGIEAQYNKEHDAANAANESRYEDILGGYGGLKNAFQQRQDSVMSMLANNGAQQKLDIQQTGRDRQGAAAQDLVSRGLSATTIGSSTARGIDKSTNADLARADDAQRAQAANVQAGLSADTLGVDANKLNFMERKTDNGPDFSSYAGLISSLNASNARPGTTAPGTPTQSGDPSYPMTGGPLQTPSQGVGGVGYHDLPPGVNPYYTTGQPGQNAYRGQQLLTQRQTYGF